MIDLQDVINAMNESSRRTRSQYQLTLGGAINVLETLDPEKTILFDIGMSPSDPHSYRGYYSDLCFESDSPRSVGEFLADLKSANGHIFEGYKGGDFKMDESTPLWVAPYGSCGVAMMAIKDGDVVTIETKDVEADQ